MPRLVVIALVLTIGATAAWGEEEPYYSCFTASKPNLTIYACTDIIERGEEESKENLDRAYYRRGRAYTEKGEYDHAISDINRAIEIELENDNVASEFGSRGDAYFGKGEFDLAIADYSKAIELDPHNPYDHYFDRGVAYEAKGDLDRAIADYSESIKHADQRETYHQRGNAYVRKGEYRLAADDFTKVIEKDDIVAHELNILGYERRAWSYLKLGEPDVGVVDAERAVEVGDRYPNSVLFPELIPSILNTRGQTYAALGRRDEAIADLERALKIDPGRDDIREALERIKTSPNSN